MAGAKRKSRVLSPCSFVYVCLQACARRCLERATNWCNQVLGGQHVIDREVIEEGQLADAATGRLRDYNFLQSNRAYRYYRCCRLGGGEPQYISRCPGCANEAIRQPLGCRIETASEITVHESAVAVIADNDHYRSESVITASSIAITIYVPGNRIENGAGHSIDYCARIV